MEPRYSLHSPLSTWQYGIAFLLLLIFPLFGIYESAHPPRKIGQCSWIIDTSLRPSGVLHTPNFPARFNVPTRCKWILNASHSPDSYIVIWFTQLYVLTGIKITEYIEIEEENIETSDIDNDDIIYGGVGAHVILDSSSSHSQLLNYTWVRSMMPYLVLELHLDQLEGNHVRTRDNLLDVFGFNVTYELIPREKEPNEFIKHCSVMECSYAGNCIADATLEHYECVCYEGFFGERCEFGPLCNAEVNPCLNGGICRHMTADAVLCTCSDSRFFGPLCEFSNVTDCEKGGLCEAQCAFDGRASSVCNCGLGPSVPADRARYETTIGLANVTRSSSRDLTSAVAAAVNPGPARPLEALLESKLQKFLRGWNLTRVEDVKVLRVTVGSSLTFSFISGKQDREEMVLPALNALVRRGRLGPFELKPVVEFKKEPALYLESVRVNRERVLHEGNEFILSCLAQGSTAMEFRWFKDGIPVNDTLALRDIEQSLLSRDSRDMYTALLRIVSASRFDEGNYTCQVVDRGVQQCKSIFIEVAMPPGVTISPMSVTLSKGDNLTIFCMSSNDKRNEKFGFNWTKNNALLPASAGREMMEDLHPDGLLLRIYNAHQSATYACHVQGGGGSSSARVEVAVTTPGVIPLCRSEVFMGVQWPYTAPGQEARQACPAPRPGSPRAARRLCTLYDTGVARWHQPDFSECVSAQLEKIHKKFHLLTLGYVATTPEATLRSLLTYLASRSNLLPGEGEPVLSLLQDVHNFMRLRKDRVAAEVVATSRAACQALNVLLEHQGSLTKPEKVSELQHLMRRQALLWGAHLGTPSSAHLDLSAALLDVARLTSTGVYRLRFPLRPFEYPSWFSDKLDVRIQATNSTASDRGQATHPTAVGDSNVTLAVIVYRSLSNFLPERYVARKRDGDAVELELNSRVVSISAVRGSTGAVIEADGGTENGTGFIEVELELARRPNSGAGGKQWNSTCAATRGTSWNLESSCILMEPATSSENVTRCRCLGTGTFAALLTMNAPTAAQRAATRQLAVALGCAWCLVLSMIALVLLAVHLWLHRSCLTFLKLQACATVIGAMVVFICTAFAVVPQNWNPSVTSILETCLLVGLSSPLSTLMLVYTEVVQMRPAGGVAAIRHLRHTVVSTITGLPVLAVFCSHLAHSSTSGGAHPTLALTAGTPRFTIFVVSALGMAAIFMVVHSGATRRLHVLAAQNSGKNKAISRRIGLLKRATAIFSSLVSVIVASLFYINIPSKTYQYAFSVACALLGFVLLFCFAIKSETPLRIKDLIKMKEKQKSEGEFSSESLDSPLRLFLRPDVTRGNESANPGIVTDVDEGMTIVATSPPEDEGRELLPVRHQEEITPARRNSPSPAHKHSSIHSIQQQSSSCTAETYIQPLNTPKNVNLESYDSSPKKYQQDIVPRPQAGRCFIEDSNLSAGVIVQACVEPEPSPTTSDQAWVSSSSPSSSISSSAATVSGYVNMNSGNKHSNENKIIRPIPVAPPCVPDLTYLPSLNKTGASKMICGESILINNSSSVSSTSMNNKNKPILLDCKDVPLYCNNSVLKQSKEDNTLNNKKCCRGDSTPRVTFSGCDTVVEVDEPPPTPPPPPLLSDIPSTSSLKKVSTTSSSHDLERKQPDGREMTTSDDNVEGMLDRISHDLDYLLSRKTEITHQLQQPLRSALSSKKSNKTDLKVKIKEPGKVIYINSPTHSCNGACDSTE